jgi:hypothetical protein
MPTISPQRWIRLEKAIGWATLEKAIDWSRAIASRHVVNARTNRRWRQAIAARLTVKARINRRRVRFHIKIESATRRYLENAALEHQAVSVLAAIARVKEIKSAAAALHDVIMKPVHAIAGTAELRPEIAELCYEIEELKIQRVGETRGDKINALEREIAALAAKIAQLAAKIAQLEGERRIAEIHIRADKLRALALASREMARACDVVLHKLGAAGIEDDRYRVGHAWGVWIRRLKKVLEAAGLRVRVSKRGERTSPFTAFTRELQFCVPLDFRRHTHSPMALAVAIVRALDADAGRINSTSEN